MVKKTKKQPIRSDKRTGLHDTGQKSYYDEFPRWAFHRVDFEHQKWGLSNNQNDIADIIMHLKNLEGRTWGDILSDTSGRVSNTRNHFIDIDDIIDEAKKRAIELRLEEFSGQLLSIAISGKNRIWGILQGSVLEIVWCDPNHEICPSLKRHT